MLFASYAMMYVIESEVYSVGIIFYYLQKVCWSSCLLMIYMNFKF